MAGIYIHIPFCKTRCVYCGFFSTTSLERRDSYVNCVCNELKMRCGYLGGEEVDTIYFGGGTPSQLDVAQIRKILDVIFNIYNVRANAEITLEGNPDDLTPEFLAAIFSLGVNRLSMGVQSFNDGYLRFIRRRHSSDTAVKAVANAVGAGFRNISIDLMYGFPGQTIEEWTSDVDKAISLPVQHISAYSLMYEDGTPLAAMLDRGEVREIDDELSLQMYTTLVDRLSSAGYEHYEISNFCRPGFMSRHNSGYWSGAKYLGVGAGAHSYNGEQRHYNPDSLSDYMNGASLVAERLSTTDRYNEYVFTGLRTKEGIDVAELKSRFGAELYDYCISNANRNVKNGTLTFVDRAGTQMLRLTQSGVFVSNDVMSDLMWVDD